MAIVTGGSSAIGGAICRVLADHGWDVALTYFTNDASAGDTVHACESTGVESTAIQADLAERDAAEFVFTQARKAIDAPVGGFIHCAANLVFARIPNLSNDRYKEYLRSFDVNTHALLRFIDQCSQIMTDNGRIIALSSLNSNLGLPGSAAYAGSKAASEAHIRTAAHELGKRQITCNTVQLGLVDTPTAGTVTDPGVGDLYAMQSPLGRIGRPDDVAALVAYLCSPQAGWMTGQSIRLDGGFQCR